MTSHHLMVLFDISVFMKSLLSPLVSEDVELLWELDSFSMSIDIVFCEDTEISRFSSLDNVEPYHTSLIYTPLMLFIALLCY